MKKDLPPSNLGRIIALLLCLAVATTGLAQNPTIDGLRKQLDNSASDTARVNTLLSISKAYSGIDPSQAILFAGEARDLAEKIHYSRGQAYALKAIGNTYAQTGKYPEAITSWEAAMNVFDAIGDKSGVANILSNQGAVYFFKSDDAKALELYLRSLKMAEEIRDTMRMATVLQNIGAVYSNKPATQDRALEYYQKALPLCMATGDLEATGNLEGNIGEIYLNKENDNLALDYFEKSLKALEGSNSTYVPTALNNIGRVYLKRKDYTKAINYHLQAFDIAKKLNTTLHMAQSLIGIADTYLEQGSLDQAIAYYQKAIPISREISGVNYELKNASAGLALAYARKGDFKNAYVYQNRLTSLKDSLYNIDTDKKLTGLQSAFDIQKKQSQIDLLTKDRALQDLDLKRQRFAKNALIGGMALVFSLAFILYRDYRTKIRTNKLLDSQKAEIEHLLENILPSEVAKELQENGEAAPRYYDHVSVLFTDFKSFSMMAEKLTPQEVVSELNACFIAFDGIIEKYQLEKIKTIGDSYMCAGGIPTPDEGHPQRMVRASLEIQHFIRERNAKRANEGLPPWDIRIGIHVGPVVAGVVGRKKYAYDIWGSTVNIASRMESNGEPGKVNISAAIYELVKDEYNCVYRGKVFAKNIGEIDMYFVEPGKPEMERGTMQTMPLEENHV